MLHGCDGPGSSSLASPSLAPSSVASFCQAIFSLGQQLSMSPEERTMGCSSRYPELEAVSGFQISLCPCSIPTWRAGGLTLELGPSRL